MNKSFAIAALAAGTMFAAPAHADVLFVSYPGYAPPGSLSNGGFCSTCNGYGGVAGSFTLSAAATLTSASILLLPDFRTTNMQVYIFRDGGNDLPASSGPNGQGFLPAMLFQDYTFFTSLTTLTDNRGVLASLALPNWNIDAGKYWIAFHAYASTGVTRFVTPTPGISRMVGTDFGFNAYGRNITYNAPDTGIGFSLNGVSSVMGGVPEPATWAMMILGFGIVGAGMRRRSASVSQPRLTVRYQTA